jgi:Gluconate 2-dehydrogenase subunit 3
MNPTETPRMDRRTAIKWMMTAAASMTVLEQGASAAVPAVAGAKGYGMDPDLLKGYSPGDVWPLTFSAKQKRATVALCDVMIPADEKSPKASDLGVPDFIDEWISSPYPGQAGDRKIVTEGLAWIDAESQKRFQRDFADLRSGQQTAICDAICNPAAAKPEHKAAVAFFKRFRDLTAGGYYTTPQGMRDLGYVGNVAMTSFEGPTPEVLRHIGLA